MPTLLDPIQLGAIAGAGLIISEATGICRQGLGWPFAPGIWSEEQVAAWRPVTDAVKRAGGRFTARSGTWGASCVRASSTAPAPRPGWRGGADAIAFGRGFLANPDLPSRVQHAIPLAPDHMETW